ncbi:MAG: hypothetical protein ACI39R_08465 [Lachnospiraceae bacterium]
MKKMKKVLASVLAGAMMVSSIGAFAGADEAADATTAYIAFADSTWSVQAWNGESASGVEVTTADVTGYGQYTVSVDVTNAVDADGNAVTATDLAFIDVEISNGEAAYPNCYMTIDSVKINGAEVELASATYTSSDDDVTTRTNLYNSWVSDATTVDNARTADGSNDGITATPLSATIGTFTSIEVTFTLGEGALCNSTSNAVLSEESYPAFIALGGDKAESNDWAYGYYGSDAEGVTAVNGELKSGETTTLSLTFDEPVLYTWFVAPCMVIDNPEWVSSESTFDVKVFLDGVEVDVDLTAGDSCWAEATGDYATNCLRIAGGYNEWGTKYLAESPAGFTEIKFEITPQIYIAEPVGPDIPEFDPEGTYHAYIGIQTGKYSFRNEWSDTMYGIETDYFNQITAWDEENNAYSLGGTFVDAEISANGTYTVSVSDFGDWSADFAEQDYFNLLFISSDIPNSPDVVLSDIVLKIDGVTVASFDTPFLDPESVSYQKVLLANVYNSDVEPLPYFAAPAKSIEISFTISGFSTDLTTDEPDAEPTEAPKNDTNTNTDKNTDTPASTDGNDAKDDGLSTGLIVGIVIAAVVVIGVVVVIVVKKKKK